MLEAATAVGDTLVLGDVVLFDENLNAGWEDFKYPEIDYEVIDPETKGLPFMRILSVIRRIHTLSRSKGSRNSFLFGKRYDE